MTTAQKTKKIGKKTSSSRKKVKLVGVTARTPLRHLKLVEHKHTLKLIHHKHTSHAILFIILAVVGIFLYASQSVARAQQITSSEGVTVGMVVPGTPPPIGATITSPQDGSTTTALQSDVSGTCGDNTLVIIYDNGQSAGSTMCSSAGVFELTIQLLDGANALQALDYDALNQVGPSTPTVTVTSTQPAVTTTSGETIQPTPVVAQSVPKTSLVNPFIIPTLPATKKKDCSTYDGPAVTENGSLKVSVVCFIRDMTPLAQYQLGLLIQGGKAPYAVNIDWGTSKVSDSLISVPNPSYKAVDFAYPLPGLYTIRVHVNDVNGEAAYTQTVAEVNGTPSSSIVAVLQKDVLGTSWFETPVPFYLIAVTLTVGFWVGDLFDRRFGAKTISRRSAKV